MKTSIHLVALFIKLDRRKLMYEEWPYEPFTDENTKKIWFLKKTIMPKHLLSNFKKTFQFSENLLLCARLTKIKVSGRYVLTQIVDFRDDYIDLYIIKYTQLKAFQGPKECSNTS